MQCNCVKLVEWHIEYAEHVPLMNSLRRFLFPNTESGKIGEYEVRGGTFWELFFFSSGDWIGRKFLLSPKSLDFFISLRYNNGRVYPSEDTYMVAVAPFPVFGRKEILLLLLSLLYTKGVVPMLFLHMHRAYDCDIRRRHFDACDFHHCGQRRLRRQTPQISKKEITASLHNKAVIS